MIWALAALQAAVTLSWMVYGYFQPLLLQRFGFTALAGALEWYLVFTGTTLAPIAGMLSDRIARRGGGRFPVVRAGVALAAASFVAVALTARAEPGSGVGSLVPLLVAVWIAGMTVFTAPALSIVGQGAPNLTASMAPLVVATALPSAAWPWVQPSLAWLGSSATFLAGGTAVTLTALALGRSVEVKAPSGVGQASTETATASLGVLLLCGLASALVVLLAWTVVPQALSGRVAGVSAVYLAAVSQIASAVTAPAAARLGAGIGSQRALTIGLLATVACRVLVLACGSPLAAYALAAVAGAALALHLTTALPYVLSSQPGARAGLAAGLYLGGAMIGSQLGQWLSQTLG